MALAHVLLGAAEGKDLVSGVREAVEFLLRLVGRHPVGDDLAQALHLHIGPSPPHSVCRQVGFQLALLGGMQAETRLNQQAQEPAVACALGARLLGQLAPACL